MKKTRKMNEITIELGKGVVLNAPFKKRWNVSEWRRMTLHIDLLIKNAK